MPTLCRNVLRTTTIQFPHKLWNNLCFPTEMTSTKGTS